MSNLMTPFLEVLEMSCVGYRWPAANPNLNIDPDKFEHPQYVWTSMCDITGYSSRSGVEWMGMCEAHFGANPVLNIVRICVLTFRTICVESVCDITGY